MRLRQLLKAKLHHARVTYANPEYVGSIEIGHELMDAMDIEDGELVHVWAVDSKSRITTYAFRGPSGAIGLNGGAAHYFQTGDRVVIAAFDLTDQSIDPNVFLLDESNKIIKRMDAFCALGAESNS